MPEAPDRCSAIDEKVRDALSIQQCTRCHNVETGTPFRHVINQGAGETPLLSDFLTGGQTTKPSLMELYLGHGASQARFKYDGNPQGTNGTCQAPASMTKTRHFNDIARRSMFLSAVANDDLNPNFQPIAAGLHTTQAQ
jgi:hypothetical protein